MVVELIHLGLNCRPFDYSKIWDSIVVLFAFGTQSSISQNLPCLYFQNSEKRDCRENNASSLIFSPQSRIFLEIIPGTVPRIIPRA